MNAERAAPPYLRIAASLRRRIETGQLCPGDRLPSTRALARRWGVALATAAHALDALVRLGLVETIPRVGVRVLAAGARSGASRGAASVGEAETDARAAVGPDAPPQSTRERIVSAAIAIADAEGLAALSLRGIAARLDAPVTSLYRHVRDKAELLHLMADAALGEERLPAEPPAGWRAMLEVGARSQWRTFRRHPWLGRLISITRPRALATALAHADWALRALDRPGVGAAVRLELHIVLYAFVQGMATNAEAEAEAAGETGMNDADWMRAQGDAFAALAATGRYPAFAAVTRDLGPAGFHPDLDAIFELGLARLLDGFARLLRRSALPATR